MPVLTAELWNILQQGKFWEWNIAMWKYDS